MKNELVIAEVGYMELSMYKKIKKIYPVKEENNANMSRNLVFLKIPNSKIIGKLL